jgi:hypothetical protein
VSTPSPTGCWRSKPNKRANDARDASSSTNEPEIKQLIDPFPGGCLRVRVAFRRLRVRVSAVLAPPPQFFNFFVGLFPWLYMLYGQMRRGDRVSPIIHYRITV